MLKFNKYFKDVDLKPRNEQKLALEWMEENWDCYDYFILQLPTGVGKTHFALAATEHCRNAWIATSTIQLMDQYLHSNGNVVDIKGRANYECYVVDSASCEFGPCRGNQSTLQSCKSNNFCPYENQKNKAFGAKWTITNYTYLIYSAHCGFLSSNNSFSAPPPPRDVAIFDEAHNLEKHLISFATHIYDFDNLFKYKNLKFHYKVSYDMTNNIKILEEIKNYFEKTSQEMQAQVTEIYKNKKKLKGNKYSSEEVRKAQVLVTKIKAIDRYLQPLKFWTDTREELYENERRWIIHPDLEKNTLELVPLKADFIFNYYFNNRLANKFIFMSAMIGDPVVFCEENGIPKERTGFFETDSPFDPTRSPVYSLTGRDSVNTRYGELDKNLGKIIKIVEKIMEAHATDGGIIHTGNYKIAQYIWNNINQKYKDRLLFKKMHDELDLRNEDLLKKHEDAISLGKSSVLLSPSLMEGVDLKDDLSRFQIVVKLPFSSLGDIRVKKKTDLNNKWYTNEMMMKLVQSCGRSTRNEGDWSRTYIIDDQFPALFSKLALPQWFRSRVTIIKD